MIKGALQSLYVQMLFLLAFLGSLASALLFRLMAFRRNEKKGKKQNQKETHPIIKGMVTFFLGFVSMLIVFSVPGFLLNINPDFMADRRLEIIRVGRSSLFVDAKGFLAALLELLLAILGKGIW